MTPGSPATEDVFGQLAAIRVIPVVVLEDSAAAAPLARALAHAGLPSVEITLRTAAGETAISIMAQQRNLLVGAGTVLDARQAEHGTRHDLVPLGEVMLRLDPGEGRIRNSRSFTAREGGGEYNVARGLRRCFGLQTAIVTALADNDIGWLIEDLILQGGVDTSLVQFVPYDGATHGNKPPHPSGTWR